ncbi:phosphorylase superfamily protein, partial [Colletotrichum incanum]
IWEEDRAQLRSAPGDYNTYNTGRMGSHDVVLLLLPNMGKSSAASAAASLRSSFTGIKLAILTGICGGVPGIGTINEVLQCDYSCLVPRSYLETVTSREQTQDGTVAPEIRVVVGRVGSGDTVVKAGLDRDRIAKQHDLIAFEMEGAGVWEEIPCIIVKAVCDYADSHKNKKWQQFAAATAASTTKALLEHYAHMDSPPAPYTWYISSRSV